MSNLQNLTFQQNLFCFSAYSHRQNEKKKEMDSAFFFSSRRFYIRDVFISFQFFIINTKETTI